MVDFVINNTGVIEANSIGSKNGMIVLSAATGASKPAGAPAQTVKLTGKITASGKDKGTNGGTVVVSGENIVLKHAKIDASGDAGGGKVLIGGDTGGGKPSPAAASIELAKLETFVIPTATTVSVDAGSVINASATGTGNGGKVVLWSDQQTTFAGTILAQGGTSGGNGGFVETSGHTLDFTGGRVNTSAPLGNTGNWLLDPTDLNIDFSAAGTISSNLQTTNVLIQTFVSGPPSGPGTPDSEGVGDINVNSSITWSSNNTLTFSSYHDINVGEEVTIKNTGAGNLVLRADNTGNGRGTVSFFGGVVDFSHSTGMVSIYYNPTCIDCTGTKYQNPNDYSSNVLVNNASQLTAYMLVNSANDLQIMGNSADEFGFITGNFALGKSFDAGSFEGFASGTTFNGLLDGNGGLGVVSTISNLSLTGIYNGGEGNSYGLFPFIGSNGIVRNLNLANVSITAGDDLEFLGALAGQNNGTISNVSVLSGTVDGLSFTGIGAGGLVGQNLGTITGSSANVTVTLGDATNSNQLNIAGGLVASNLGLITNSSATGNVSGGAFSYVGGLVGQNGVICDCEISGPGTISSSFATGSASGGTNSVVGGFVAFNSGGSIVAQSHATGQVSGSGNVQLGGFVGINDTDTNFDFGDGIISNSYATGSVTGTNLVSGDSGAAAVGGFAGQNNGTITNAYAANIGGINGAGANFGDFVIGGFVGSNSGTIQGQNPGQFTYATGNVTGSANSIAGGFAGQNAGNITFAFASGNVHVGSNSYAGGFVAGNMGMIFQAFATGAVTDDGNSVLGGFGAFNVNSLSQVFATGAVTGGTNTVVGGLVAVNGSLAPSDKFGSPGPVGSIVNGYATGMASGGAGSIVAGLVAVNDGAIKTSYSAGAVSGGTTGGLVAKNNPSFQFADLNIPSIIDQGGTPVPLRAGSGTITNSYWNTETSGQSSSAGGTGMTTQQLVSGLPAGFDASVWTILPDPSFPYFPWSPIIPTVDLPSNNPPANNPPANPPSQTQIIDNLTGNLTLVSLPPSVNVLPYPPPPPGPVFGPQFVGEPRLFAIPPRGETRYRRDEVLLMVDCDTPQSTLDMVAREMHLTIMASQCLTQTHLNLLQMHIDNGRPVAQVIQTMRRYQVIALAQANFIYQLMQDQVAQDLAQDPDLAGRTQEGDAAQYALGKLGVIDIHKLIKGTNVVIAVIDFGDRRRASRPRTAWSRNASARSAPPRSRIRTAPAWRARSRRTSKLIGIAPGARLLAVHAFSSKAATRREHDLPDPQGHRLVGGPGRAHHQHELRRPARSRRWSARSRRPTTGHRADRGGRQCRPEIAAAVSRRRSERDRGDGDRRRRQAVHRRQSRQATSRSPRPASTSWCRRRTTPISSPPAPRSPPPRSAASWR